MKQIEEQLEILNESFEAFNTTMQGLIEQLKQSNTPAVPAVPAPPAQTPPPVQYVTERVMTEKAGPSTKEQFIAQGWTEEMMIQHGYMEEIQVAVTPEKAAAPTAPTAPTTPGAPAGNENLVSPSGLSFEELNAKLSEQVERLNGNTEKVAKVIAKYNNGSGSITGLPVEHYDTVLKEVKKIRKTK